MTKQDKDRWQDYRRLTDAGFEVSRYTSIQFNSGSETYQHVACKTAAGFYLAQEGYVVDSEVECPTGEIDLLAYGRDGYPILAVECEVSPVEDVVRSKLDRYVKSNTVVDDMFLLNVNKAPRDINELYEWVGEELHI